jgi:hypothetical protein
MLAQFAAVGLHHGDHTVDEKRYKSVLKKDALWKQRLEDALAGREIRKRSISLATTERGRTLSKNEAPAFVGSDACEYKKAINVEKILRNSYERNRHCPTLRQVLRIDDDIEMEMLTNDQKAVVGRTERVVELVRRTSKRFEERNPSKTSEPSEPRLGYMYQGSKDLPLRSSLKGTKEKEMQGSKERLLGQGSKELVAAGVQSALKGSKERQTRVGSSSKLPCRSLP